MRVKVILRKNKELNKALKKVKKTKVALIKSLVKGIEINLLTLAEVELANEDHLSKLPRIIRQIDEYTNEVNELVKEYRKYI